MKLNLEECIKVGSRNIGMSMPCFVIAEVSLNHEGQLELAKELAVAAANSGADAVKFQDYRTEDFLSDSKLTYTYDSQGTKITETQWDMFKRYEPESGWWPQLKELCEKLNIAFFATPTSEDRVRDLVKTGVPLLKNGSDYLTHTPLLEYMGRTGVPVIASTGMADQQDVDDAVEAVARGGRSPLILLHCTSAYPTSPEDTNLRRMVSLRERYSVPVGFSDHTTGWLAAIQAVTLGACVIEKHFTLDRNLPGPDHSFSSTPEEFKVMVENIRLAELALGRNEIQPAKAEMIGRKEYRLSIIATEDLSPGSVITEKTISYRRPGDGILPKDLKLFLGRPLTKPVTKGSSIKPEYFA